MFYCYLISFLLTWAALSSYWRWVNNTPDVESINWFLHGLGIGLAMLPFVWVGVSLWLILFRSILLGVSMMFWSDHNNNVVVEEMGRGALIVLTLPILFM